MRVDEVYPTLLKITSSVEQAGAALFELNEAVADVSDENYRIHYFLEFAEGYKRWLLAGLPALSAAELRAIGHTGEKEYGSIVDGFTERIETERKPIGILSEELKRLCK